jgi:hypothetical protein
MKTVVLKKFSLGEISLLKAFDICFQEDTMRQIHGETTKTTQWSPENTRYLSFEYDIHSLGSKLQGILGTSLIHVSVLQTFVQSGNQWTVKNSVDTGIQSIVVQPTFHLTLEADNRVYLEGKVTHSISLPIIIKTLVQSHIIAKTVSELEVMKRVISSKTTLKA